MTVWGFVAAAIQLAPHSINSAFVAALQAISRTYGPIFCPSCQIDLLTNPETLIHYDGLRDVLQLLCNCQQGAFQITKEDLDNITI